MSEPTFLKKARLLARRAHADQVDRAGRPYRFHLARVAAAVVDDPLAEAVAWLHDLIEDHPQFAPDLVASQPEVVIKAVEALTRRKGVPSAAYYAGIREVPLALRVKLADIADNCREDRLACLEPAVAAHLRERYRRARAALMPGLNQGEN